MVEGPIVSRCGNTTPASRDRVATNFRPIDQRKQRVEFSYTCYATRIDVVADTMSENHTPLADDTDPYVPRLISSTPRS
jgi:hypothetical protein